MEFEAHYWAAAAKVGFANPTDWRHWADRKIEQNENAEYWIIAMSLSSTVGELLSAIDEKINAVGPILDGDAMLGFLFWNYKLGRITFPVFLEKAGWLADCSHATKVGPEGPNKVLNELERRNAQQECFDDLIARIDTMFEECWQLAKEVWRKLGLKEPSDFSLPNFRSHG
jgi:hypothetical protein